MNKPKHSPKQAQPAASQETEQAKPEDAEKESAKDLGLVERRRSIRPLPVPHAQESDGDSDWAAFQALISEESQK